MILAVRMGWLEESKKISEMIPASLIEAKYQTSSQNNNKTVLMFIEESTSFNPQQKRELSEILRMRVEEINNDKPSSSAKISDIETLKTSSLEHKK